jgi:dipeptidyl aminopeptidase/acylaminoacyl peptidase
MDRKAFKLLLMAAVFSTILGICSPQGSSYHELDQKLHTWNMKLVGYTDEVIQRGRVISGLWVVGNYAYLGTFEGYYGPDAEGHTGRLLIVDVSDPTRPKLTGELALDDTTTTELKVNAEGTIAILTNERASFPPVLPPGASEGERADKRRENTAKSALGFTVIDVSDKSQPQILSRWVNRASDGHRETCHSVFVHTTYAYCASLGGEARGGRGVVIVDISDPKNPKEIAVLTNPEIDYGKHQEDAYIVTHDLWVQDDPSGRVFAYVANGHGGLQIWDVTVPSYPLRVGSWTEWGMKLWAHSARTTPDGRITVVGPEQFDAGFPGFLAILDTSHVQHPKLLATWKIPGHHWQSEEEAGNWTTHNYDIADNKIYLANYHAGVWVIDISDPTNPKTAASFGPDSYEPRPANAAGLSGSFPPIIPFTWAAEENNGYVYISDMFSGFYVAQLDTTTSSATSQEDHQASPSYTIAQYLDIQSSGSGDLSPDGTELLYTHNATGTFQVYKLHLKTNQITQLTHFADPVSLVGWSPTGTGFLFGKAAGGNERTQLYWMSRDGQQLVDLSKSPHAIHSFGDWSPDGRKIAFAANRRDPAYFDIYIQDLQTKELTMIYQSDATNSVASWSPDGRYLVISVASASLNNDLYLLDIETKQIQHLTPHEENAIYSAGPWTRDSQGFFVLSDQAREFVNLAYLDITQDQMSFLEDLNWDVEGVGLSRDGKILGTVVNVEGYRQLRLWNWPERTPLPVPSLPQGLLASVRISRLSEQNQKLTFSLISPRYPGDVWMYDLATQEVRQLTHSSLGTVDAESFVEPTLIKYPTFDGRMIPAFFYLPKGANRDGRLPVVIDIHGGPESQARPVFSRVNQYLLHRGYAILQPNVRGSTGYGKAYTHLDDVHLREDSVIDIAYAVEWLKRSGYIDPAKIVVMGGSYGGYMVLACLTLYPDLFAAGVDIVGIANFVTFLERTAPYRRHLRESEYGSLEKDRELLVSISPIHRVDRIRAPLFVIHGANDPRVPIGEAEQIVAAVEQRGGIIEYLRFEDEGHGLAKRENQIQAYTRVVEFLDQYVLSQVRAIPQRIFDKIKMN